MNKKALLFFAVLVILQGGKSFAKYSGGYGSSNEPYLISEPNDLIAISSAPDDWDKHFLLTTDLSFQGQKLTPIGYYRREFTGVFDGNGFSISNIVIDLPDEDDVGLFGCTKASVIKNVTLENVYIVGGDYVGSLVGFNKGIISNIDCSGIVNGGMEVGGIVGVSYNGVIKDCNSSADIYVDNWFVGGLCGYNVDTPIINCHATGDVIGSGYAGELGGLVGGSRWSYIINCSASGNVTGERRIGGLVGWLDVYLVKSCYATGNVQAQGRRAGGLVGTNAGDIENSYATGNVHSPEAAGGLVGFDWSIYDHILNCISTGTVTGGEQLGGFTGYKDSTMAYIGRNYFDSDKNPLLPAISNYSDPNVVGRTTAELFDPQTFISTGWDFTGETQNGTDDYWTMPADGGYPVLSFQVIDLPPLPAFGGGNGSIENPFLIASVSQFNLIGDNYRLMDKHFRLTADLDFAGLEFTPIGTYDLPFTGTFDGNKKLISNVVLRPLETLYVGVFGSLDSDARVFDLGVENLSTQDCENQNIGGIAGESFGAYIERCYVKADISEGRYIGLIVGDMDCGKIENCYAIGSISGASGTNTIVGWCSYNTKASNSYSSVSIDSVHPVNKIYRGGVISNVLTATAEEMMNPATFIDLGWDFVDEDINGTEDIWGFFEGSLYPQLAWQVEEVDVESLFVDVVDLGLGGGIENSLLAKLDSAAARLEDDNPGNDKAASNVLRAFINSVKAQRGKKITEDDADRLIEDAEVIIDGLNGDN